jgi:hypothetical protein
VEKNIMITTIINDCRDANAQGRQTTRLASLLGVPVNFVGVANDLEASGSIIDVLDALEDRPGLILVNVAPRDHAAKKWENGTPFGFFKYKNALVVSTIDGHVLSLVKKFQLTEAIEVMDIPTVVKTLAKDGAINENLEGFISESQFRSFDFLPRIGAFLAQGGNVPTTKLNINEISDAPHAVWFIDNFGNCKVTALLDEIKIETSGLVKTSIGNIPFVSQLKSVSDDHPAIIVGSSGLDKKRFLEIVVQGGNASQVHALSQGDIIFEK